MHYSRQRSARRGAFDGEGLSAKLTAVRRTNPMDQRIESFLADVLALAGEDLDAVREGGCGSPSPAARRSSGCLPAQSRLVLENRGCHDPEDEAGVGLLDGLGRCLALKAPHQ